MYIANSKFKTNVSCTSLIILDMPLTHHTCNFFRGIIVGQRFCTRSCVHTGALAGVRGRPLPANAVQAPSVLYQTENDSSTSTSAIDSLHVKSNFFTLCPYFGQWPGKGSTWSVVALVAAALQAPKLRRVIVKVLLFNKSSNIQHYMTSIVFLCVCTVSFFWKVFVFVRHWYCLDSP